MGVLSSGSWRKSASKSKAESYFMNKQSSDLSFSLGERLEHVADTYRISRDPSDYLLIPARANSVGRLNANLDGWTWDEIKAFRPELGCLTYETYRNKPHFVEHNAAHPEVSRGFLLDAHINADNDASPEDQEEVFKTIGTYPAKDVFVETLIAVDTTKDKALAAAYKNGSVSTFSMGADVEATQCNVCGNVASTTFQFCDHVRNKFQKREYQMPDGSYRLGGELCIGTVYQELSAVADPADKTAVIQDGLLSIQKAASSLSLTDKDREELIKYTIKNAGILPESVAKAINFAISAGI
jgi:hypothetical protein